jgi:hypothetical protein
VSHCTIPLHRVVPTLFYLNIKRARHDLKKKTNKDIQVNLQAQSKSSSSLSWCARAIHTKTDAHADILLITRKLRNNLSNDSVSYQHSFIVNDNRKNKSTVTPSFKAKIEYIYLCVSESRFTHKVIKVK